MIQLAITIALGIILVPIVILLISGVCLGVFWLLCAPFYVIAGICQWVASLFVRRTAPPSARK